MLLLSDHRLVACLLMLVMPAIAQNAVPLEDWNNYGSAPGSVEIGGVTGVLFLPEGETRPLAGTALNLGLHRFVSAFGEFAYSPLLNAKESIHGISANATLMDYSGGLHMNIPTGTRVLPFASFGIGAIHINGKTYSDRHFYADSDRQVAYSFGGGTRLYLTSRMGLRFDLRAYKASDYQIISRFGVGVFFHINKPGN